MDNTDSTKQDPLNNENDGVEDKAQPLQLFETNEHMKGLFYDMLSCLSGGKHPMLPPGYPIKPMTGFLEIVEAFNNISNMQSTGSGFVCEAGSNEIVSADESSSLQSSCKAKGKHDATKVSSIRKGDSSEKGHASRRPVSPKGIFSFIAGKDANFAKHLRSKIFGNEDYFIGKREKGQASRPGSSKGVDSFVEGKNDDFAKDLQSKIFGNEDFIDKRFFEENATCQVYELQETPVNDGNLVKFGNPVMVGNSVMVVNSQNDSISNPCADQDANNKSILTDQSEWDDKSILTEQSECEDKSIVTEQCGRDDKSILTDECDNTLSMRCDRDDRSVGKMRPEYCDDGELCTNSSDDALNTEVEKYSKELREIEQLIKNFQLPSFTTSTNQANGTPATEATSKFIQGLADRLVSPRAALDSLYNMDSIDESSSCLESEESEKNSYDTSESNSNTSLNWKTQDFVHCSLPSIKRSYGITRQKSTAGLAMAKGPLTILPGPSRLPREKSRDARMTNEANNNLVSDMAGMLAASGPDFRTAATVKKHSSKNSIDARKNCTIRFDTKSSSDEKL